jgi:hypothetical protein
MSNFDHRGGHKKEYFRGAFSLEEDVLGKHEAASNDVP